MKALYMILILTAAAVSAPAYGSCGKGEHGRGKADSSEVRGFRKYWHSLIHGNVVGSFIRRMLCQPCIRIYKTTAPSGHGLQIQDASRVLPWCHIEPELYPGIEHGGSRIP